MSTGKKVRIEKQRKEGNDLKSWGKQNNYFYMKMVKEFSIKFYG